MHFSTDTVYSMPRKFGLGRAPKRYERSRQAMKKQSRGRPRKHIQSAMVYTCRSYAHILDIILGASCRSTGCNHFIDIRF